jgi:hypothetical protein
MRRLATGLAALFAVLCQSDVLLAQCASPELLDTIPPDGASNVPQSWSTRPGLPPLVARYDIGAVHNGEPVVFQLASDPPRGCDSDFGPWCLAGSWDSQSLTLTITPNEPFLAGQSYRVVWPGLRSITDSNFQGADTVVEFTVGYYGDGEAPSFAGLTRVDWDFERKYDSCSDTEAERYLFDVSLDAPSDDGGAELLMLRVFQTEGSTLFGVPTEVHVQRYSGENTVRFKRPISAGVGRVCFSALVSDPGGNFSTSSANREVCTTTLRPPFFEGCALGRTGPGRTPCSLWLLGFSLLVAVRRTKTAALARG